MRTFTDQHGNEWKILIGLYTANRIKELSDGRIDFVDTSRAQNARGALIEMAEDVEITGRVAWWLCEEQASERGLTEEQFADGFNLDTLIAFQTAVAEAVIDFFPSRSRAAIRQAAELAQRIYQEETETIDAAAQEILQSPELETMIRGAIRGQTSGSSPDLRAADPLMYSGDGQS